MEQFGRKIDYTMFTCPVQKATIIVGDKWTIFIIREFIFGKAKMGFNEMLKSLKPISSRTLTLKLKKLVGCGILLRRVVREKPIKVEYSLTDAGKKLDKILREMGRWFNETYAIEK